MSDQQDTFEGWAILELMGHRRLGGFVKEQELAGKGFIRIDIPANAEHEGITQLYNPDSLYALTPTTEEIARKIADDAPMPVTRWELRAIEARSSVRSDEPVDDEEEGDDALPYFD
jgi:hypothetical protein